MRKWVWLWTNGSWFQLSQPSSVHWKLTKHGLATVSFRRLTLSIERFCMHNYLISSTEAIYWTKFDLLSTVIAILWYDTVLGLLPRKFRISDDVNLQLSSRCEAFSTYPRTYDLVHADGVFSMYQDRYIIAQLHFYSLHSKQLYFCKIAAVCFYCSILTIKLGWFCCIQVWHSWRVDRDGPYIEARRSGVGEGRGGRPQQGYVDHSRYAMGVPNGRPRGRSLGEGEDYGLCEDLLGWCSLKHDYVIITCLTIYSVLFVGSAHWFKSTTLEHLHLTCPKEPAQLCIGNMRSLIVF